MKILAPRSNLGVRVCRPTEPILNDAATFDQYGTLVFAAVLSLARWYSNKTILLFLSLGRVHQKPLFDQHKVTFVSVTQSFNTTTSMGRLTLNVLLSFAQFEREVIGERIRDKFTASRKRGIWMGGWAPLGYEVRDRKLVVNEVDAKLVRSIFQRFLKTGSATTLARELIKENVRNKYGKLVDKGILYKMLSNPVYIGLVVHKGVSYPGEHIGIIDRKIWDEVQSRFQESPRKRAAATRTQTPSLLKGIIFGPTRAAMSPTHTRRNHRLRA